jgi:prepilin-type N-terminal cleavage/methylation domain-containing protein
MSGIIPKSQRGFTIVEVMMATAILLVGFIGLIQAVTIGSNFLDTARKIQVANQIITAEIEKLRSSDWTTIANLPDTGTSTATITISAAGAISGDATNFALSNFTAATSDDNTDLASLAKGVTCSFTRTYLRPSSATSATATYLQLVYTVSWKNSTGKTQSQQLAAYFAKNGLHLSFQQS